KREVKSTADRRGGDLAGGRENRAGREDDQPGTGAGNLAQSWAGVNRCGAMGRFEGRVKTWGRTFFAPGKEKASHGACQRRLLPRWRVFAGGRPPAMARRPDAREGIRGGGSAAASPGR